MLRPFSSVTKSVKQCAVLLQQTVMVSAEFCSSCRSSLTLVHAASAQTRGQRLTSAAAFPLFWLWRQVPGRVGGCRHSSQRVRRVLSFSKTLSMASPLFVHRVWQKARIPTGLGQPSSLWVFALILPTAAFLLGENLDQSSDLKCCV